MATLKHACSRFQNLLPPEKSTVHDAVMGYGAARRNIKRKSDFFSIKRIHKAVIDRKINSNTESGNKSPARDSSTIKYKSTLSMNSLRLGWSRFSITLTISSGSACRSNWFIGPLKGVLRNKTFCAFLSPTDLTV